MTLVKNRQSFTGLTAHCIFNSLSGVTRKQNQANHLTCDWSDANCCVCSKSYEVDKSVIQQLCDLPLSPVPMVSNKKTLIMR